MPEEFTIPYSIAETFLAIYQAAHLNLKLGTSDISPDGATVLGDYVEATGGGYVLLDVLGGDWTLESNSPRDIILSFQASFGFTGPLVGPSTIYTLFLVDDSTGSVYWGGKRLDTPFVPAIAGDTLLLTPRIQAGNGTPT